MRNINVVRLRAYSARVKGKVVSVDSSCLIATLPQISYGDMCVVKRSDGTELLCEVISIRGTEVKLAPLDLPYNVHPGAPVEQVWGDMSVKAPRNPVGCVLAADGRVLRRYLRAGDDSSIDYKLRKSPPDPLKRIPISQRLATGVGVVDLVTPIGFGQRIGLFAKAGTGKSTLLGMMAKNSVADVNIVALVGERGREVREFIEDIISAEGMKNTCVVVSTSDEPAPKRRLAAYTALAIAEYAREQGRNVFLMVDSITRMARAIREIGLAAGELPVRQGYPPRLYSELPNFFERAGASDKGSITAVYTVLEEDEELDPVSEEIKSLLDGHIALSHEAVSLGLRPAVDISRSVSRLTHKILTHDELAFAEDIRKVWEAGRRYVEVERFGGEISDDGKRAITCLKEMVSLLNQGLNSPPLDGNKIQEIKRVVDRLKSKN